MDFLLTFKNDFPAVNYYKHFVTFIKRYLQANQNDYFPEIEDMFIVDFFTTPQSKIILNNEPLKRSDIVFLPLNRDHTYERELVLSAKQQLGSAKGESFITKEGAKTFLTTYPRTDSIPTTMVYSKEFIRQVLSLLKQSNSDILNQKDIAEECYLSLNVEIFRNNPILNATLSNFMKDLSTHIVQHNSLAFELGKLNVLTLILQTLVGKSDQTPVFNEFKAIRQEIISRIFITKDYMEDNYAKDITLDELSKIANLSKGYYTNVFTQVMHQSPLAFLIQVRMQRAKYLLECTSLTIGEVALQVGIQHLTSFYRSFRAQFGVSPGFYRKLVHF